MDPTAIAGVAERATPAPRRIYCNRTLNMRAIGAVGYWGLLMRAGNDKSKLAYQVERYADIYTSRVSNFGPATPFFYVRSPRGSLPHDPSVPSEQVSMA